MIYDLTNKVLSESNHASLYTNYKYILSNNSYETIEYNDILINFSCLKNIMIFKIKKECY